MIVFVVIDLLQVHPYVHNIVDIPSGNLLLSSVIRNGMSLL